MTEEKQAPEGLEQVTNHTADETAQNFGEIAKSYAPEFVAKWYKPELESFLCGRDEREVRLLPKTEQHALIVLEVEMMYGTEYAQDVNDRLRKLWDIRDELITKKMLAHDYDSIEELPDVQSELAQLMIDLYIGHDYYRREWELKEGTSDNKFHEKRRIAIENFIGSRALKTLEQIPESGLYEPKDLTFLEEQRDIFLDNFYKGVSESGFSVDELKAFYEKGKLIIRQNASRDYISDVYIFMMDVETKARAFLLQESMFGLTEHGFEIKYSPDFSGERDLVFSSFTKKFRGDTQENGNQILGLIRDRFA